MFAEDLWVGLPGFAWRCGPRGWVYVVARNAANRLLRSPHQRKQHKLTLPERASLSALIAQVRSATQAHRRTEAKAAIQAIRERLDPDDQMLLVLRVDKGMQFRELALVMNDGELPDERVARGSRSPAQALRARQGDRSARSRAPKACSTSDKEE